MSKDRRLWDVKNFQNCCKIGIFKSHRPLRIMPILMQEGLMKGSRLALFGCLQNGPIRPPNCCLHSICRQAFLGPPQRDVNK
jgi:hypothetical protein